MDFPILQQSGVREGSLGKMGEKKESICKDMEINKPAILIQYLHLIHYLYDPFYHYGNRKHL